MADILLIDDEDIVTDSVRPVLSREGYRVNCATPGMSAIRKMLMDQPDLVILGIDPSEEGWQFCHQLLTFLESPLLLLLATDNEKDRIKALRLGADTCMVKPVRLGELVARVQALLRRRKNRFVDGALVVDFDREQAWLGEKLLALTPTEFQVLCCLVQHAGEVVPYNQLLARVWGPDRKDSHNLVKSYIHHLRQKLEPDPRHPQRIVTRLREGYVLQRIGQ